MRCIAFPPLPAVTVTLPPTGGYVLSQFPVISDRQITLKRPGILSVGMAFVGVRIPIYVPWWPGFLQDKDGRS